MSLRYQKVDTVIISPFSTQQGSYWGDHTWKANDENDSKARTAYEALLRVSLLVPSSPQFHDFTAQVKRKAKTEYNYPFAGDEEVSNS